MTPPGLIYFLRSLPVGLRLSSVELEATQLRRLSRLVEHAYEAVPYYRRLFDSVGFRPRHLKRLTDLRVIPITTRGELQAVQRSELIAKGVKESRLKISRSSGSSGAPLQVFRVRRERWLRQLLTLRAFVHNGLRWDDRVLTISRLPSTPVHRSAFYRRPFLRRWNISFFEDAEKQLETLLKVRPTVMYGYAPSLAVLGDLIVRRGGGPMPLRLGATSAEILMPGYRTAIQKGFGVDPLDVYNCTELGDIAWQCSRRAGFHVNADWLHVEIMRSDNLASPGESGEVVVTNLYRYAMPLIRYNPGDFASPAKGLCPCGLGLPLLDSLDGRAQTLVPLPGGRYFIGFSRIMSGFPEIARYQVVQSALDHFVVNVIPGAGFSRDTLGRISSALGSKMGTGIRVEAREAHASELVEGPGKFRPVIPIGPVDFSQSV
jgi:phenylacetate-coenzyme A ligase PaaK-like adenylate-forming protein